MMSESEQSALEQQVADLATIVRRVGVRSLTLEEALRNAISYLRGESLYEWATEMEEALNGIRGEASADEYSTDLERVQSAMLRDNVERYFQLESRSRTLEKAIRDALDHAEMEGVDYYKGTNEPRPFATILREVLK